MRSTAGPASNKLGAERQSERIDSQRSTLALTVIIGCNYALRLWVQRGIPYPLRNWQWLIIAVALGVAAFVVVNRHNPKLGAGFFDGLNLALGLPFLVILPLTAVAWTEAGRPFEAEIGPRLFMLAIPLAAPHWFRAGLAMAIVTEINMWLIRAVQLRHGASPDQQLFIGDPYLSLVFFIVCVACLAANHRRRELLRGYLRASGEVTTIQQMGETLVGLAAQLDHSVRTFRHNLAGLWASSAAPLLGAMRNAADRLEDVKCRLDELHVGERAQVAKGASIEPAVIDAERRLHARDAQNGATTLALMIVLLGVVVIPIILSSPELTEKLAAVQTRTILLVGVSLLALFELWRTRHHPSFTRGLTIFLMLFAAMTANLPPTTRDLLRLERPVDLFSFSKLFMAALPLMVPRYLWLGVALEALLWGEMLVVYYALGVGQHFQHVSLNEPWQGLLFAMIGIALFAQSKQRRLTSLRLLRAQAELAALRRSTNLSLALRDRIFSPLQVLALGLQRLRLRNPADPQLTRPELDQALERLIEAAEALPDTNELIQSGDVAESFDAAAALRFQG